MMKTQVCKSEQLLPNMSVVLDYDQPIRSQNMLLHIFNEALSGQCVMEKYGTSKSYIKYEHDGQVDYFLTGAITYLSKPHPLFKKRLQLKKWFKDFYNDFGMQSNVHVHIIGVYHYEGMVVFVEFNIDDYIGKKMNSSAAHIYLNDIYQGVILGYFEKTDAYHNRIAVIPSRKFKSYIDGEKTSNKLFDLFDKFNNKFEFGEWIPASKAIMEMRDANWYQWKGAEWPGWLLEYKVACFVQDEHCEDQMRYIGDVKGGGLLDFDLHFHHDNFYGDLKASDISKSDAPGNDQEMVLQAIMQYGKLWYVIYEHETIKDIDMSSEMAKERMKLIGKQYVEGGKISYAARMKHSVNFKRMRIYELNRINMNNILSTFNQGHQPDGKPRAPKFLINKRNAENCIIYSYDVLE